MQPLRWLSSLLRFNRTPSAALPRAARIVAQYVTTLRPESALYIVGLSMIAAGTWPVSREASLTLLGLLIIREIERPDPKPKS